MRTDSLFAAALGLTLAAIFSCACAARSDRLDPKAPIGTKVPTDEGFYAQESRDGRTFVMGKSATFASFKNGRDMQLTKSFIAAGPSGETVVVEVDPLLPEMTERLTAEFSKKSNVRLE
ncbi:MAG TPA: hypothetical protein VKE69_05465 [Planctomycetota bacterium]|nr:hypothetical protein [Planctomycetota bacterium]